MFNAVIVKKDADGVTVSVSELDESALPTEGVKIAVAYSSINYKDGLVLGGLGNLVKSYPHIPGIDLAGHVLESDCKTFSVGDEVVVTGWRIGELYWGGMSQRANMKPDFVTKLPAGMSPRHAMVVGTAGLTAMLSIIDLEAAGMKKANGPVLVTGATGGVGTFAVSILSRLGYEVVAASGKPDASAYLQSLGASSIITRSEIETPGKPLEKETWAAAVDSVGGSTLARVLAGIKYGGAVASVGLVGGSKLETTVVPFLLRGIRLLGIDSVMCNQEKRELAWRRLVDLRIAQEMPLHVDEIGLGDVAEAGKRILAGKVVGRTVVAVS